MLTESFYFIVHSVNIIIKAFWCLLLFALSGFMAMQVVVIKAFELMIKSRCLF